VSLLTGHFLTISRYSQISNEIEKNPDLDDLDGRDLESDLTVQELDPLNKWSHDMASFAVMLRLDLCDLPQASTVGVASVDDGFVSL
jgi:hypothetical protein